MADESVREPLMEAVAGNGLLHRRLFLARGAALLGGATGLMSARPVNADPLEVSPWMKAPGTPTRSYGQPSRFEADVQRSPGGTPNVVGSVVSSRR